MWTDPPTWAVDHSRVTMCVLLASLIKVIHALPVSLGGWPCLGVLYPFHFQMIEWTVVCEMFKAWRLYFITFSYFNHVHNSFPGLCVFLGVHDAVCLLMFSSKEGGWIQMHGTHFRFFLCKEKNTMNNFHQVCATLCLLYKISTIYI